MEILYFPESLGLAVGFSVRLSRCCYLPLPFPARSSLPALSLAQFFPYREPIRNSDVAQNMASASGTFFTHLPNVYWAYQPVPGQGALA